jgi:hypothetical protein
VELKRLAVKKMPSPGILRRVALVRSNVSEERIASIIRMSRIGKIGTTLAVTQYFFAPCVGC